MLNPSKSLQLNTLQKNGYGSEAAIVELARNGKGQMPKYQGAIPKVSRMTDEELADVASVQTRNGALETDQSQLSILFQRASAHARTRVNGNDRLNWSRIPSRPLSSTKTGPQSGTGMAQQHRAYMPQSRTLKH